MTRQEQGWSAEELEQLTSGAWIVAPTDQAWNSTGICAEATQFRQGQMLLARAGVAGLRLPEIKRLVSQCAGIIGESGNELIKFGVPVLEVADLRKTVTDLAVAARSQFGGTVVAVTGSVGKTTTVAMAAQALAGIGKSDRSRTSANSPYGIGWNLASMDRDAQFWVQEMAIGRMDVCTKLVRPDIAIVTAIAPAHAVSFGSTRNIAEKKARIYLGMKPGSIAVINRDMPEFEIFETAARAAQLRVMSFGSLPACDAQLLDLNGNIVRAKILGMKHKFELGAPGRHMAMNAIAVLAAVAASGLSVENAAAQFADFEPLTGRGKRSAASFEGKEIQVWDDCYNANPASMKAALQTMQDEADTIPTESRLLILGDMLELGTDEQELHLELEEHILALQPDRVLLCGSLMKALEERLSPNVKCQCYSNVTEMSPNIDRWVRDGDVVLIKASHGVKLGNIVNMLTKNAA